MKKKPRIGVTGPKEGIPFAWWATRFQLLRAGARPVRLTPGRRLKGLDLDGLVLGGGNDIDPVIYGGDLSSARNVNPKRDDYELRALEMADKAGIPVLGICRGSQLINVHAGGSLIGDITTMRRFTSNRASIRPVKKVKIKRRSKLADMLKRTRAKVNSLHHQAIDQPANGFRVVARDADDIVQSIERRDGPLRIGVQWHPEYMPQRAAQRRLFEHFVRCCASHQCPTEQPDLGSSAS